MTKLDFVGAARAAGLAGGTNPYAPGTLGNYAWNAGWDLDTRSADQLLADYEAFDMAAARDQLR